MNPQAFVFLLGATSLTAQTAPADPVAIVTRSVELDRLNTMRARDYTFIQKIEHKEFEAGKVKKLESDTYDVVILGNRPYRKKIARNDKPLSADEAAKVQSEFDKEIRKRQSEGEEERKKALAQEQKREHDSREFLAEIPRAFDFRIVGEELVDNCKTWVIDATPKPGYRGRVKHWELLTKFQGRFWIDQSEYQWVRVQAVTIAPVSFGWFLARLEPGAKLNFLQSRVNSEVWLPARATTRLNARIALFRRLDGEIEVTWKDYKKFQADSHIVEAREALPQ